MIGDLNSATSKDEVSNQDTFSQQRCVSLKDGIFSKGIIDLGYTGSKFT